MLVTSEQPQTFEQVHDLFSVRHGPLDVFVRPKNVAMVGASEKPNSVGRSLVANLLGSPFGGKVFLINPRRSTVLGHQCYPSLGDAPEPIDLAVIVVPACVVPQTIAQCLQAHVRGAIVISAGFKEIGSAGAALEHEIRNMIVGKKLRLIGPNCMGVMSPVTKLNATFAASMARPGNVGLISQSGAMLSTILDWSVSENIGFSHVFSVGSMLDVGWGDLIEFLGDDPHTTSIVMYMESIGNAKAFLSAAREVALQKPIIIIKAGRSEKASQAAASHTGAMVGSDDVLDAAFRRVGAVRVHHVSQLFNLLEALAKQPRPRGPRLAIVTNAGGPGVLATDALMESGGQLANLSSTTLDSLNRLLPSHWSHGNPVDVLGDASPERFAQCAQILAAAPECDGLLAILAPQAIADPAETARQLVAQVKSEDKPILSNWIGGSQMAPGVKILNEAGIPTFTYPDSAARTFQYTWQYSDALRALYETPSMSDDGGSREAQYLAADVMQTALSAGRTLLTEPESKQVLSAYGIPTVETLVATNSADAVRCARKIGYPVALKLLSKTISHKTDVAGVRLNLQSDDQVANAFVSISKAVAEAAGPGHFDGVTVQQMLGMNGYELLIGCKIDSQLGPVIAFGAGGQLVEVFQDRALGLPPLTSTLARRMMERTKIYRALKGIRGRKPVDLAALEQLLVRFSRLVLQQPRICEIEINPLLAGENGFIALDARVILHPATCASADLPQPVIRPYPRQYMTHWTAKDGRTLFIRPIRPEDESLMASFHESLSQESVYSRYAQVLSLSQRTAHERLARLCFIDYDRQIALVAIDELQTPPKLAAVARLIKLHASHSAEFAIVVSDVYQGLGLGTQLMDLIAAIGRDEKLQRIVGQISVTNRRLLTICQQLGFEFVETSDHTTYTAILNVAAGAKHAIATTCNG
ncbi:MAG TPA: bifunctional acetate--CoA ligase family protein/GNAT family N-acetyltransferase [Pirellulales bacterium]|nr:bifunctional acetate--CoA ligase family protein/GNAT family N-acetyltransferase [Pirellulales bacterium]